MFALRHKLAFGLTHAAMLSPILTNPDHSGRSAGPEVRSIVGCVRLWLQRWHCVQTNTA
jgi:hypothetical protein